MKNNGKIRPGFYLTCAAAILVLVGAFLYKGVMYQNKSVPVILIISVLLAIAILGAVLVSGKKIFTNLLPLMNAVLTATALGMAVAPMTNEIAMSFSGLNSIDNLKSLIVFAVVIGVAWILNLIAAFIDVYHID